MRSKYQSTTILTSVILICGTIVFAQERNFYFTRINNNQGLSHNQVNAIYKDKIGFMWFGTMSGLNRYDGYDFKVYRHDYKDSTSLSDNFVTQVMAGPDGKMWVNTSRGFSIYDNSSETFSPLSQKIADQYSLPHKYISGFIEDNNSNFWFILSDSGFYKYNSRSRTSESLFSSGKPTEISSVNICAITLDPEGYLWIMTRLGLLEKLNPETMKVVYRDSSLYKHPQMDKYKWQLFSDAEGDLWIFSTDHPEGVFFLNRQSKEMIHLHKDSDRYRLNTNIVIGIIQDNKGVIWLGTDHGGINLIDKSDFSVSYISNQPDNEKSLSQNSIYSLYKDDLGIIWIGTFKKGINYFHEDIFKFQLDNRQHNAIGRLSGEDVNCFVEDDAGNLWIGTNGGGLFYFDRANDSFKRFLHDPDNPSSISSNIIVSLLIDHEKKLWVGTFHGGLNCFDGEKFVHYKHDANVAGSISNNKIWEIFEDSQKNLWFGTHGGGLDRFDRKLKKFINYNNKQGDQETITSNYISSITEDKQGNLYIGTFYGLNILPRNSNKFTTFTTHNRPLSGLTNDNLYSVLEDSRGLIWIATREGLNLLNKKAETFSSFRKEHGLADNTIFKIIEDLNHDLWLSTPIGLTHVKVEPGTVQDSFQFHFKNYDKSDGLQENGYNHRAAYRTRNGELLFGGANGFNLFNPDRIEINRKLPQIVFTDFQIFNKSYKAGEKLNGRTILEKTISETPEITLKHNENVFSIEFAALSYFHASKNKYAYKLEGFNNDWLYTDGNMRRATYTNLNPGEYHFKVRASNNDEVWDTEGVSIKITVLPPFWKTQAAFSIYLLVIVGALLFSRRIIQERERLKYAVKQERQEAKRMHELDLMKIRFFTNVSHEFRTPLSLILAPVEKLLTTTEDPAQVSQYQMIQRNAKRLLNLVNQLLDFRKLEVQGLKLNSSEGDIIKFLQETTYSFSDLSEKKNIHLSFRSEIDKLETFFDQDKLEKIIFNLLSNAFKFTPEYGEIEVKVQFKNDSPVANSKRWLEIKVSDSGIGIPADKHKAIFERFFQNDIPGSLVNQGSGIGLSITKEFVKLHGGKIHVSSEVEKGSCFTIILPIRDIHDQRAQKAIHNSILNPGSQEDLASIPDNNNGVRKKPLILVIEDNEDFRFYLKDNLAVSYAIIEAGDGKEGLRKAEQHIPDLIVSDVMMPEMDGVQLCKELKSNKRTARIPVILLTARSAEEQKLEGYRSGANEYITKPFSFQILASRIKNILTQRKLLEESYKQKIEVNPTKLQITSLDDQLINKAIAIVERNISDAEFSVNDLSKELGMSRVYLYKKILALTGKSPLEFIRTIRLKRAAQLLEESQLTIAEIAYEVGFNNPKYFSKYFKAAYKKLPSMYSNDFQSATNPES